MATDGLCSIALCGIAVVISYTPLPRRRCLLRSLDYSLHPKVSDTRRFAAIVVFCVNVRLVYLDTLFGADRCTWMYVLVVVVAGFIYHLPVI